MKKSNPGNLYKAFCERKYSSKKFLFSLQQGCSSKFCLRCHMLDYFFFWSQNAFLLVFQLHILLHLGRSPCRAISRKPLSETVLKQEIIGYSAKPECSGLKPSHCCGVYSGPFLSVLGKSSQSSVFFTHLALMRSLSYLVDVLSVQTGLPLQLGARTSHILCGLPQPALIRISKK